MTTPPPPSENADDKADDPAGSSRPTGQRHSAGGRRWSVAPWIIVTVVSLVVVAGLATAWFLITGRDDSARPACTGSVVLPVAASPGAAPALQEAARRFDATGPTARSTCVTTAVTTQAGAQVAQSLLTGWTNGPGDAPAVWVVDDSADLATVEASQSGLTAGRSTQPAATSPVVLAVRPADAATFAGRGWTDLLADPAVAGRIALPDPRTNRATGYALQSMLAAPGGTDPAAVTTAAVTAAGPALQTLAAGTATGVATTADALDELAAGGAGFTAVPITEADLAAYNSGRGAQAALVAVYPTGPTAGDEIQPVALSASWVTPTLKEAGGALLAYLRSADGQAALADQHLRVNGGAAASTASSASRSSTDPATGVDRSVTVVALPDAGPDVTTALAQALGLPA